MAAVDPAKRVGNIIAGKYKLVRVIGSGGMGAIYEAIHAFTGRRVALKLMHPEFATSAEAAARFLREAQAAASIGHPGIVEVLDAGSGDDGTLYLALELLEGRDLGAAIDAGDLSPGDLVAIGISALEALAAAHARGIVHRDVKPGNVFVAKGTGRDTRVKVLDFGIAKQLDRESVGFGLTKTGAILGTPYYMSPEQTKGLTIDQRADLWSVGAMMFHALARRPPFDAPNYNALIILIITEAAPSLRSVRPDLPDELIEVIDRSMKGPIEARWQTATEFASALRACEPVLRATGDAPTMLGAASDRPTPRVSAAPREWVPTPALTAPIDLVVRGDSASTPMSWDQGSIDPPAAPKRRRVALVTGAFAVAILTGLAAVFALRPRDSQTHERPVAAAQSRPTDPALSADAQLPRQMPVAIESISAPSIAPPIAATSRARVRAVPARPGVRGETSVRRVENGAGTNVGPEREPTVVPATEPARVQPTATPTPPTAAETPRVIEHAAAPAPAPASASAPTPTATESHPPPGRYAPARGYE